MILPSRLQDLLDFFDEHYPLWVTNFGSIGITTGQATAFKTAALNARTQFNAQLAALTAAAAATATQQVATRAARVQAAEILKFIKAYALTQSNPQTVYTAAGIPAPATPTPAPPPGMPTNITAGLEPSGAVTLRWKAANPAGAAGTVWNIARRTGSVGAFTFVGASGPRVFTDTTLPAGSPSVQYVIQGQRSGAVGIASGPFTVQFGVGGGGGGLTIAAQFSEAPTTTTTTTEHKAAA